MYGDNRYLHGLTHPFPRRCSSDLADIAVLVERLAEGGDDGDEIEPGGGAGGKSGDGDHQQRVEPKQEADDDDKNSGKDEKVVHGAPKPPPPGVSITNISPASISAVAVAVSSSTAPSLRTTRLIPAFAAPPPASPEGGTRRRLERMPARIGSKNGRAQVRTPVTNAQL